MESTHSQPLLQENDSDSDVENFGQDETNRRDDLITENVDKQLRRNTSNVPHDKYNFNYIIFYLMGMTTLLPWNFFITAEGVSNFCYYRVQLSLTISTVC